MRHSTIHATNYTLVTQDKSFSEVALNQQFLFAEYSVKSLNCLYVIPSSGWESADLVTSPAPLCHGLDEVFEFIIFQIPVSNYACLQTPKPQQSLKFLVSNYGNLRLFFCA